MVRSSNGEPLLHTRPNKGFSRSTDTTEARAPRFQLLQTAFYCRKLLERRSIKRLIGGLRACSPRGRRIVGRSVGLSRVPCGPRAARGVALDNPTPLPEDEDAPSGKKWEGMQTTLSLGAAASHPEVELCLERTTRVGHVVTTFVLESATGV